MQLALQLHVRKIMLSQCLVQDDGNRIGQIERSSLYDHRNTKTLTRMIL